MKLSWTPAVGLIVGPVEGSNVRIYVKLHFSSLIYSFRQDEREILRMRIYACNHYSQLNFKPSLSVV